MDKSVIDQEIEFAYDAIQNCGICNEKHEVLKTYRSQLSSFGAAISMGSLMQAIAFFSEQGNSSVERPKILEAIFEVMKKWKEKNNITIKQKHIFEYVRDERKKGNDAVLVCQNDVVNAAIALKLAMNLYTLVDKSKREEQP